MRTRVAVIDYGMGNLYSVCNSFISLGIRTEIVSSPQRLARFDKLILPGVGAFGDAMKELKVRALLGPIRAFVASGKPFLGICLGMQLLFGKSEESKGIPGLGIVQGEVKQFSTKLKCPHIGWNSVEKCDASSVLFKGLKDGFYAYFCHSYFVKPKNKSVVLGETQYGIKFASMIRSGNVFGVQFHPEKSQDVGLKILENFIRLC